jgi:hypothetical protein
MGNSANAAQLENVNLGNANGNRNARRTVKSRKGAANTSTSQRVARGAPKKAVRPKSNIPSWKNIERMYGTKASHASTTVLSGSVTISIKPDPITNPANASHIRAWQQATSTSIATATQLASESGGALEVEALMHAAAASGWTILDANRSMEKSVEWLISPAPRRNQSKPILITKPKYSLTPMKKFTYGIYPPWGVPEGTMAPDAPRIFPNNAAWWNAGNRSAATQSKPILKQISNMLKENWSTKLSLNNFTLPKGNNKNSLGKGKDSAETDAVIKLENAITVNWFGRPTLADVDIAMEMKVTEGKANSKSVPAEDIQLKKHTLSVYLNWYTDNLRKKGPDMQSWKPPPVVRLYFVSWFFGIPIRQGESTVRVPIFRAANSSITQSLKDLLPLFGIIDPVYGDVFTVTTLTPANFTEHTGLSSALVTSKLIEQRRGAVKTVGRAVKKEEIRALAYKNLNFNQHAPSNYLNKTEANYRMKGEWGNWLNYVTGPGWPTFLARKNYQDFAARVLSEKIIKKLFLLEQYYGMSYDKNLPFTPPSHSREEAKRSGEPGVADRKFLDAFSIIQFLATNPSLPQVPANIERSNFVRMYKRLLEWSRVEGLNIRFDWARVPARAKTILRQNARASTLLAQLQMPAASVSNYAKNVNKMINKAFESNSGPAAVLAPLYAQFIRDHAIDPTFKASIKQLVKNRLNAKAPVGTSPFLKSIINRS